MIDKEKLVTEVVLAAAQGGTVIDIMDKAGKCFDEGRKAGVAEAIKVCNRVEYDYALLQGKAGEHTRTGENYGYQVKAVKGAVRLLKKL